MQRLKPFTPNKDYAVSVSVERSSNDIDITYTLEGELSQLLIPGKASSPSRTEGLYKHTCFEAFLAYPSGVYSEWNFSPSGDWCIFHFSSYRKLHSSRKTSDPLFRNLQIKQEQDILTLQVTLCPPDVSESRLGLTAVLEEKNTNLSYWALSHPQPKPDFHDAKSFLIEL